jgi:ribonuclease HIII
VIENLMQQRSRLNPPPVLAISDQFAASKETVGKALMALGREIELVQRHKAESDLAVAAASILARAEFIDRLAALEKACGMTLPRGASKQVDEAAKQLFEARGSEALQQVSKMHFRTAFRAQGLPEPEVREWKRP